MAAARSAFLVALCILVALLVAYAAVGVWHRADLDYKIAQARLGQPTDDQAVVYDGVPFKNKDELLLFLADQNAQEYFPWAFRLPELSVLFLGAFCFGFLGAIVRCLKSAVGYLKSAPIDRCPIQYGVFVLECVFAGGLGVIVLVLAYSLPAALLGTAKVPLYPPTLLGLCALAGLFAIEVYAILESRFRTVFGVK